MNEQMSLERMVAGWMADEAAGAPDEVLDRILATTRETRPLPRWWSLLLESPLRTQTNRAAVGLPNRGLVLATLVALLILALAAAVVGARLVLDSHRPDAGDWPGFRGAEDRSSAGRAGPAGNPVLTWRYQSTGAVLEVALDGDRAFFASDDGSLHAVSRDTGISAWSVPVANPPLLGPYAEDGRLYVSDAKGTLSAYRQSDGESIWTAAQGYDTPSRLISVDGMLYFGTSDGLVVAIDAATGAERWRLQPPGATHVDAPAFGSGLLFAGTDGAGFVAIDLATRQVVWTGETDGKDTGTATVIDGIAYIGAAAEASTGTLRAFDAKTGRLLWTAAGELIASPAVADGTAYTSAVRGLVTAIDTATGATRWALQVGSEVRSPVIAGGIVYFLAGTEHRLYAVDATSGSLLWSFDVGATGNCCIAVTRDAVYVGLQDGSVEAIGGDGSPLTARPFPTVVPSPSPTPAISAAPTPTVSPATATWTTDLRGKGFEPICQIALDPTGRIWAPEADTGKVAILDPDGTLIEEWGEPGSRAGQFDFTRGNDDCYGTLAFEPDGSFYVLDPGNRRIQAFDRDRRFVRQWGTFGHGEGEFTDPIAIAVAADGSLWVLDDIRHVVEHFDRDGNVIAGGFDPFSNAPINNGANTMAIGPNGHFYVTQVEPNQIAEFASDGTFIRAYGETAFARNQPTNLAIDAAGRVFVTLGALRQGLPGVIAFAADGSMIGGFGREGRGDGQVSFPAGIALDGTGSLYLMDSDPASARLFKIPLAPPFAD